jgi:hypothetical protein
MAILNTSVLHKMATYFAKCVVIGVTFLKNSLALMANLTY